ncbi:hypothetical protein C7H19_10715 [Aphanothece hegewaldii CCALA 016]|uniref:Uncharacterized protein n=1 Tax=Aphanothece hegewaldii CCALA 016 TaxID=2107694 RepID=A0A2T1LYC3_9CHRO|nr:hypothetical protein [Aphanothece hegewaldii]PSF37390.1 hypothetical protein C7H19_10715 [Aphanothece hegewaldii CCALA 016]
MITESSTEAMTDEEWEIAHAIAHSLSKEQLRIDAKSDGIVNEFKKTISYFSSLSHREDAQTHFLRYIKILVENAENIGHSNQTFDYYRSLEKIYRKYLQDAQVDTIKLLKIIGWSSRLFRYYKYNPIAEVLFTPLKKHQFKVDDLLDARVVKKNSKGSKVTYEIQENQYYEKETKNFAVIPESGLVKVRIVSLNLDESINHVKFVK